MATPKALTNTDKSNPLEQLSIKQIRFLQEYIKTGNMTDSWIKFNKTKNRVYAYQAAANFLKRYPDARQAFFDMHGVNDVAIAKALNDGFKAQKGIVVGKELEYVEDAATRIKTAELANKILGNETGSNSSTGNQLNVQIIADGGVFKVVEG
jgi:hypothetical protein